MVLAPDLSSSEPNFKSSSYYHLYLFKVVPGSTPLLCLNVAYWFPKECFTLMKNEHVFQPTPKKMFA